DYVVLTDPDQAEAIGRQLIGEFDRLVPSFYSAADRQAGRFRARDRFGTEREFSLMTMSVSILSSADFEDPSPLAISRECAKMKEHLKEIPGSNLLVNRRIFP
ncbi:MAG TPA: adenylate/guanylate cyclase domain-containing protein, partial [Gammaproteobacteria bacterium]|nr:adenylate/guanylate cyclase domain-containing protein [Gammaproteobacteria bacterium]